MLLAYELEWNNYVMISDIINHIFLEFVLLA